MRWLIFALCFSVVSASHGALAQAELFPERFEWPSEDPSTIPDARLGDDLEQARGEAREAAQRAREARLVAGQARRLVALRETVGRGPQATTIGDGVVMRAVDAGAGLRGTVEWADGSILTGAVAAGLGDFEPSPESALSEFEGWVYGTTAPIPTPMTGVFLFKSGDQFTGSYNAGTNARGVYVSSSGDRRFVGEVNFEAGGYLPIRGQVEDSRGRVLAVVR